MRFVRFAPIDDRKASPRKGLRCTVENLEGRRLLTVAMPAPAPLPPVLTPPFYDPAGTVSFSQPTYLASGHSGAATITLTRFSPIGETLVDLATADGSARAGVDYAAVHQVVDFRDGETTKTVTIPLIDHPLAQPEASLYLTLSHPATHQPIGAPATLTIADRVDVTPPTVQDIHLVWAGKAITGVALTFSEPMDPASVADVRNYHLYDSTFPPYRPLIARTSGPVGVQTAAYDPATSTVTLTTDRPLKAGDTYSIQVGGPMGGPSSLTDLAGNHLDGTGRGVGDGWFNGSIAGGTSLPLGFGKGPTLKLRGGGVMELIDSDQLRIEGAMLSKTTLSSVGGLRGPYPMSIPLEIVSAAPFQSRLRNPSIDVKRQAIGPDARISLDRPRPYGDIPPPPVPGRMVPLAATAVPLGPRGGAVNLL